MAGEDNASDNQNPVAPVQPTISSPSSVEEMPEVGNSIMTPEQQPVSQSVPSPEPKPTESFPAEDLPPASQPVPTLNLKKKNIATIIILVIVIGLIVLATGGFFIYRYIVNNNDKMSATTARVTNNYSWPTDMPTIVPQYSGGKIAAVNDTKNDWMVVISETNANDFTAYLEKFKTAGLENFTPDVPNTYEFKTSDYSITISRSSDSSGLQINVQSLPTF